MIELLKIVKETLLPALSGVDALNCPAYGLAVPLKGSDGVTRFVIADETNGGDFVPVAPADDEGNFVYVRLLSPQIEESPLTGSSKIGSCGTGSVVTARLRAVVVRRCSDPTILVSALREALVGIPSPQNVDDVSHVKLFVNRLHLDPISVLREELSAPTEVPVWDEHIKVAAIDFAITYNLTCSSWLKTFDLC